MTFSRSLIGAALGVLLASGAALAQEARPQRARGSSRCENHWRLASSVAFPITSPSPCDMLPGTGGSAHPPAHLSFSIAHVPSLNRDGIQIGVPLEVSIPRGLFIVAGNYTSPNLKFRYCDRNGCFVQVPLDTPAIARAQQGGRRGQGPHLRRRRQAV